MAAMPLLITRELLPANIAASCKCTSPLAGLLADLLADLVVCNPNIATLRL